MVTKTAKPTGKSSNTVLQFRQGGNDYKYDLPSTGIVGLAHSGGTQALWKRKGGRIDYVEHDGNDWVKKPCPKNNHHIDKIKAAWKV